ncbi:MAG: TolC family protein, partial [Nitrospinota bacterium]|nr:TolC family protein [Nitrospinota bacterium]
MSLLSGPLLSAMALVISMGPASEVRISLEDVMRQTLANNFEIAQEKLNLSSALEDEVIAESEFDPLLGATVGASQSRNPGASAFSDPEITRAGSTQAGLELSGKASTGANYKIGFTTRQSDTNSNFQSLDPAYDSAITLDAFQPLLRDSGKDVNLWKVQAGRSAGAMAEHRVKARISDTITAAVSAYWELVF